MTSPWDDVTGATLELARSAFGNVRRAVSDGRRAGGDADGAAAAALREVGPLGLLGLGIAEDRGGSGGSVGLAGLVAEVAGEELAHGAVLHQHVAAYALSASGAPPDETAAAVAAERTFLVAFAGGLQLGPSRLSVPFGRLGASVVFVDGDGSVRIAPEHQVSVELHDGGWLNVLGRDAVVSLPSGSALEGAGGGRSARGFADALTAMYMLGAAQQLLRTTVDYAKERRQFGAVIGSFQAVKHLLADASIELRHARALSVAALGELDAREPAGAFAGAVAKQAAGAASAQAAERCLQVFGGVGFTWESDVHVFLKTIMRLRQWPTAAAHLRAELRQPLMSPAAL